MKVFISWSGETGRALAELIHKWLPRVIQAVKPYYSPDDISKGARWSTEIANELEVSQIGLVIITPDTLEAPWIMFEAGALSKSIGKAKVAPIVFGLEPDDIRGPLVQFQAAKFEKTEMKRVVRMINSEMGDSALPNDALEAAFEMWWPDLERAIKRQMEGLGRNPRVQVRNERELLEEILALTRSLSRRMVATRESGDVRSSKSDKSIRLDRVDTTSLSPAKVRARLESGTELVGANLMGINLQDFNLSKANLRGANLVGADLRRANLTDADLSGANLERARLVDADVKGANISYVNFWHARMDNVRNLQSVASIELANFFGVKGLNPADERFISENNTIQLPDYGSFFEFFRRNDGMTKEQIIDTFLWVAHPDFTRTAGLTLSDVIGSE
jgi:hypothetical protein